VSCPLLTVPCTQPCSHSSEFPCSGASICALPFVAVHRFALSFSWWHVDSHSPFHSGTSGLRQPLMAVPCPLVHPLTVAFQAMDQATCGHPHWGQALCLSCTAIGRILLPNDALHLRVGGVGMVSMCPSDRHINPKWCTNVRPTWSVVLCIHLTLSTCLSFASDYRE